MAKNSKVDVKTKKGFGWLGALGFMLLGSLLTLVLPLLALFFLLPKATPGTELNLPSSGGRPDLSIQISQDYINREIKSYFAKNPPNILGIAGIKSSVLELRENSIVQATVRVSVLTGDFDIQVREKISLDNGKVLLTLADDLKIENFAIPAQVANLVFQEVNKTAATAINQQIAKISEAKNNETGEKLGRSPKLLAVRTQPGVLSADVDISINS